MSYVTSLFTDCLTSTNDINFDIVISAFSIGDIVSYDDGNGTRCYYLQSFTGTSSGATTFDTPEYLSGQCESCVSAYCDSMIAYDFVNCCDDNYDNVVTFGIYLPNFPLGTECIVNPDDGEVYHILSASPREYSYCFLNPDYNTCLDAFISNPSLFKCNMGVRRAFNCCTGETSQQIFVATNLNSGDTFSFSAQCWTFGNSAGGSTPIALINSGQTTYSSCTDCLNQTKFVYNISNCNTFLGYRYVCFNQELITGQTYQMNVTIGSGGTFSSTCFYVIAREINCTSCIIENNTGVILNGPYADCNSCQIPVTPTRTVTPTSTISVTGTTPTPTRTVTPTSTISVTGTTPTPTSTISVTGTTPTPTRTNPRPPLPTSTPTKTIKPTQTPTKTVTRTQTPTKTISVTKTPKSSNIPTSTPTKTIKPTQTPTKTVTRTQTPTKTSTPTKTVKTTSLPTNTPTRTQTRTLTPSKTINITPSVTNTKTPTKTPRTSPLPSNTPTTTTNLKPTPTLTKTKTPSQTVTNTITKTKSPRPTPLPSNTPTKTQN